MTFLGDFKEDATVYVPFTTHDSAGASKAPLSGFEADDVKIYKNSSNTQKTSTNGLTMTSPFDSITGVHMLVIDTSNDTGDAAFWVAGADYSVVLNPDTETVDNQTVVKVLAQFSIENRAALMPTVTGRRLDVSAGGEAGLDWANIGGPTTAQNLSGTTIKDATDVETFLTTIASYIDTEVAAIKAKTDNLPSDPADASDIAASFTSIAGTLATIASYIDTEVAAIKAKTDNLPVAPAAVGDIPTAIQNADALLDRANAIETGFSLRGALRIIAASVAGKVSGAGTGTEVFRDVADVKDRMTSTVDANGNRTAITLDPA